MTIQACFAQYRHIVMTALALEALVADHDTMLPQQTVLVSVLNPY